MEAMWLLITISNNVVFFFVSNLKIVYYKKLLILDPNALDKRGKYIMRH